jgi:hypothetical protein
MAFLQESEADLASRHICLFVGRHEERWEAFRPFFLKHFYAGKPTIYIHSASTREEMMDRVRDEGLDPHEVIRRGLLTLIPAHDAYLKNATFTPEFMVAFMRLQIIRKRADNHPSHLLCGEMDWFFTNAPGVDSMHEYETALNDLLVEHPQTTIVCQYDLSRFAGIDVMKSVLLASRGCLSQASLPGLLRLRRRLGAADATVAKRPLVQDRSKPRFSSQSVMRRSYSNCSHSALCT